MRKNKTDIIGFRDTTQMKEQIKEIADNMDKNVSEFVRYCVYKEMKLREKKNKKSI